MSDHIPETVDQCAERIVRTDVHSCLSGVISEMAKSFSGRTTGNLGNLCDQAKTLCKPVLDWEEAAIQAGWTCTPDGRYWRNPTEAEIRAEAEGLEMFVGSGPFMFTESAEAACKLDGLKQYGWEVYEQWAVSNWLAEQLREHGERVDEDFAGLNVWARTNFGQMISADPVFQRIARAVLAA